MMKDNNFDTVMEVLESDKKIGTSFEVQIYASSSSKRICALKLVVV